MSHAAFQKHLAQSQVARSIVADWLESRGYSVERPQTTVAPSRDEWRSFTDSGDLFVSMRVEVKGLSCEFTSAETWPFRDAGGAPATIVCSKGSWDRARPKPYGYFLLNRQNTHSALVAGVTRRHWFVQASGDRRYGDNYRADFYWCPIEHVQFFRLSP